MDKRAAHGRAYQGRGLCIARAALWLEYDAVLHCLFQCWLLYYCIDARYGALFPPVVFAAPLPDHRPDIFSRRDGRMALAARR